MRSPQSTFGEAPRSLSVVLTFRFFALREDVLEEGRPATWPPHPNPLPRRRGRGDQRRIRLFLLSTTHHPLHFPCRESVS